MPMAKRHTRPVQSGGAQRGGAAFDPATGYLLVRSKNDVGVKRAGQEHGFGPNTKVTTRTSSRGGVVTAARRAAPGVAALCGAHRAST
jgi:hypothetical protein